MTKEEALAKADTRWWESATNEEIVRFQLYERRLCMPFGRFHEAIEAVLGRPVFTHEFAMWDALQAEYEGRREPLDPLDSLRQVAPHAEIVALRTGEATP